MTDRDLLESKFTSLDDAVDAIARDMIGRHDGATACEVGWKVDTNKGVVKFTIRMHHEDHYCEHEIEIPCFTSTPLTGDSEMPLNTWDSMSPADQQACREAGRSPYEKATESLPDPNDKPLDEDEDESTEGEEVDDDSLDDYIEDPDGEDDSE